jgi:hypothetical protein
MKKAILVLLMLAGSVHGQAQLEGPKTVAPGQYFRVTSKGSVGADPKLTITPAVETSDVVTLSDGSLGLVGEISKPGRYFIFFANNSDGKTNTAVLVIEVGTEPVDDLVATLQVAYEKDGKPDKSALIAVYRRMATEKASTWGELEQLLAATVKKLMTNELRAVRDEAARYLVKVLGKIDTVPDAAKQKAAFEALADALEKVK